MNRKGFTLVELITTFALSTVVIILLINVVVIIKDVYSKSNIKSELYINQANLSNAINSKINRNMLISYESCTDEEFCYTLNFTSGKTIDLIVTEKTIKFGDYVYNLPDKTTVENPSLSVEYVDVNDPQNTDSFLVINIPIKHEFYPNINFGVKVVYSDTLANPIKIGDRYICEVSPGVNHTFFVLSKNTNNSINLIMDRNICNDGTETAEGKTCLVEWQSNSNETSNGPTTAMNYLHSATKNWTNVPNIVMNYTDEGGHYGNITTDGTTTKIVSSNYVNLKARLPYKKEVDFFDKTKLWMYNYLQKHDNVSGSGLKNINYINGYWTLSSHETDTVRAYLVHYDGCISYSTITYNDRYGVRPVITLSKNNFSICTKS